MMPSMRLKTNPLEVVKNFVSHNGKAMNKTIVTTIANSIDKVNCHVVIFSCSSSCSFADHVKAFMPRMSISNKEMQPLTNGRASSLYLFVKAM